MIKYKLLMLVNKLRMIRQNYYQSKYLKERQKRYDEKVNQWVSRCVNNN
jgi:hypothetical protein